MSLLSLLFLSGKDKILPGRVIEYEMKNEGDDDFD
jgi:hypothetical protein